MHIWWNIVSSQTSNKGGGGDEFLILLGVRPAGGETILIWDGISTSSTDQKKYRVISPHKTAVNFNIFRPQEKWTANMHQFQPIVLNEITAVQLQPTI